MSTTTLEPPAGAPAYAPARARALGALRDRSVIALLSVAFIAMLALTWRRWGMPEGDAGAELTTADLIKHGAVAYKDVRYFYGPFGLYSLALAFKVFGTSFTTAYGFGIVQAAAILGTFYALSRQWLEPLAAGLTTGVLLAIGFSGNTFNFILPHTNSATFGILTLLLMLLALRRGKLLAAGVACGLVALTRPEFLAVAGGVGVAYLVALWRTESRARAIAASWRLAVPAIVIPIVVYGYFAAEAGLSTVLWQNLWPKDFLKVAGFRMQAGWMPFDIPSVFGLIARAAAYLGLLGALVVSVEGVARRTGARRVLAFWPLAAVAGGLAVADGLLAGTGLFPEQRHAIQTEFHHLVLGMSWLPALAFGTFAVAALRLKRRADSPLGGSWPADFALIVAAVGLGLRAYNAFTAEGSYAPYYAAPLVLLLGILHVRIAAERPRARLAVLGALGLAGVGLAAYSLVGMYRHIDTPVHTPRGTFMTYASAAPALQATVRTIDADTRPSDSILAAPLDGGFYFFADRRPASYALTLLPGLLYGNAAQQRAIRRLERDHATLAVIASRNNSLWKMGPFGTGYDKVLGNFLRSHTASTTTIGSLANPAGGTLPSHGFTVIRLKGV